MAAAAVLVLLAAQAGQALERLDFTVTGGPASLARELKAGSMLMATAKARGADPQDIFADARSEYGRLIGALYARGYYAPVIHVLVDGREAAGIAPLDAPASITSVVVTVDPGPIFAFSRAEVAPLAPGTVMPPGFSVGKPAESGIIQGAVTAGIDGWRGRGHAKAVVAAQDLSANHIDSTLSAAVRLEPGPVLRFGPLVVEGAVRLREARLRKIAGLPVGERYDPAEVARVADRLRRTGVFRSVTLVEDEAITAPDLLGLTATVVEAPLRRYSFGAEIESLDGAKLTGSWLHRNLMGGGERLTISGEVANIGAQASGIDYNLGITLDRPATPGPDTTASIGLSFGHVDEQDYRANLASASLSFTHYFSDVLTAHAGLGYAFSEGHDSSGDFTYRSLDLPLGATWDRRDSITDAKKGFYIDAGAKPFLGFGSTENGARLTFDVRGYKGLGDRFVLAARVQGGAILGASALGTPRDDLFYSGGGGTVRGQPYQSLGASVLKDGVMVEIGGTDFAAGSVEGRVKLTERIGVVGFVDAGIVGLGGFSDAVSDWHAGAGLGLRYETGFGPIRLDVAAPVGGSTGTGMQIYVGLGQAF